MKLISILEILILTWIRHYTSSLLEGNYKLIVL